MSCTIEMPSCSSSKSPRSSCMNTFTYKFLSFCHKTCVLSQNMRLTDRWTESPCQTTRMHRHQALKSYQVYTFSVFDTSVSVSSVCGLHVFTVSSEKIGSITKDQLFVQCNTLRNLSTSSGSLSLL